MRKLALLFFLSLLFVGFNSNAQIIITGVIDGPLSGGVPKAIELFAYEAIPDLSIYGVGSANNGGGSNGEEFTFPAVSVGINSYILVASEATGFTSFFGFAPDYTTGAANINGDDAIELFKNGAVIDVFGDINTDGTGEPWEHLDGWAYRVDNTGPDGETFVLSSWTFSGPDALDGETTNSTAATPFPIKTFSTALPVELTSFSASVSKNSVKLSWNTATEINNYGFEIQRSADSEVWSNVGFINGNGTTNSPKDYLFVDDKLSSSSSYYYRLKQVDNDGSYEFSKTIEVVLGTPTAYELDQNYPNPFNPSTLISFTLPEAGFTNLVIFNSLGQEVATLVNNQLDAGSHQYNFDAKNLTSGIYFYKLESDNFVQVRKMMLLK